MMISKVGATTKCLEVLGIDSLEVCRLHYDLVFVYKMLFGFVDL